MTGTVIASRLNVRDAPQGNAIGSVPRGTRVTIHGSKGEWLEIDHAGGRGFVSARFVRSDAEAPPDGVPPAARPGEIRLDGDVALGPGGIRFARCHRLGVFSYGRTSITQFLQARPIQAATSLVRIMEAVSVNEGKLEAINTWDDCFMTFGTFQWTAGVGADPGELPALLARLRTAAPAVFSEYFAQYGLGVDGTTARPGSVPVGRLSLDGRELRTAADKEKVRSLDWAYRFWRAGHDDAVRRVQVEHAIARLDCFYRVPSGTLRGRCIADYVTSEYGVALILDQHVNRPGHVPSTLVDALAELARVVDVDHPDQWSDEEERELLEIYLHRRAGTSMTHGAARGEAVRTAVEAGRLSDRRGSFAT